MNASRCLPFAAGVVLLVPSLAMAQGRPAVLDQWPAGIVYGVNVPIDVDPTVTNAPYSSDAITTVTQVLGDGTKIERSVTAKVFRDGMGRVRREQTVIGLASLTPAQDGQRTVTISDPVERVTVTLDERAKTARRAPMPAFLFDRIYDIRSGVYFRVTSGRNPDEYKLLNPGRDGLTSDVDALVTQLQGGRTGGGGRGVAPASASVTTPLGAKTIEGVAVTGRRTSQTIPAGQIGNDRPIVISDEVWESDALKIVISSKHVDPRTGTVDYHLANIRLGEPPADLFMIPAGYTVVGAPTLAPGTSGSGTAPGLLPPPAPAGGRSGGGRGGNGRGRGGAQQ